MAVPQVAARETAIVFGIGPGLGWALAKRLMTENLQVGRLLATKRSGAFRLSKALMEVGWHMYDNSEDGTIVRREATYSCPRQTQECVFGRPAVHLLCIFFAAE